MELEIWYLIVVPLLFAAGWWMRGLDLKQHKTETQGLNDHYFKGLSLLLSDEPDKAIDLFIEVVKLNPQTIELHHALGNLFRRRGQFDRAIRIHSFLVNRAELPEAERSKALSELALDYLKAGMYDRAESTYVALAGFADHVLEARGALMRIYCTEKEWKKAVQEAEQLEKLGEDLHVEISHYYCELAQLARQAKDATRAMEYVRNALAANAQNVRALALEADLALQAGRTDAALEAWGRLEAARPMYAALIAAKKADVLAETDHDAAIDYLKHTFEMTGSMDVLKATVARMSSWKGDVAAAGFASEALHKRPSLSSFAIVSGLRFKANPEDAQAKLLADITSRHSKLTARYQCRTCGFLAHTFTWQCPGCERWESFPPLRADETSRPRTY